MVIGEIINVILIIVFFIIFNALLVMIGWNLFMPSVLGLKSIGLFEALGLSMVASVFRSTNYKKS